MDESAGQEGGEMAGSASCCDLANDERTTSAERERPADIKTFLLPNLLPSSLNLSIPIDKPNVWKIYDVHILFALVYVYPLKWM